MSDFTTWADRHCTIFGLRTERERQAIMALEPVYRAAGFSAEDLHKATDRLAVGVSDMELSRHRVAIRDAVLQLRASEQQRFAQQYENSGRMCEICQNAGCVIVPYHRSVLDGSWDGSSTFGIRYTAGVCCSCTLGQRRYAQSGQMTKDGRQLAKMMRLEDYERVNPRWREQAKMRITEEAAAAAADRLVQPAKKKC